MKKPKFDIERIEKAVYVSMKIEYPDFHYSKMQENTEKITPSKSKAKTQLKHKKSNNV